MPGSPTLVRRRLTLAIVGLAAFLTHPAFAGDFGVVTSGGSWNAPGTWTGSAVPGSNDNVYIGSTYPAGSLSTATVILTQNQSAATVFLGVESGTSGTLNLGSFQLTAANLYIGTASGSGGVGSIIRDAGGTLNITGGIAIDGNSSLTFATGDITASLSLTNGASATTAATGNATGSVNVASGSTLTLGANMNLGASGQLNVYGNSTLDLAGHNLTTHSLYLGYYSAGATLQNRGTITTNTLYLGNNQSFNFGASDSAVDLALMSGSSASTAATGNITGSVYIDNGSSLTLNAALNVGSGTIDIRDGTLNAQNNAITAGTLYVGYNASPAQLQNRGTLSVTNLYVANQTFNLTAGDAATNFTLSNGSTTFAAGVSVEQLSLFNGSTATVPAGGITSNVSVDGSTLSLTGALDLGASGSMYVHNGGTVNFGGNNFSGNSLYIGYYAAGATLQNRGTITLNNYLVLGNSQSFTFGASDSAANLWGSGASSITTSATGNITSSVYLDTGSSLTLNAALNVGSGTIDIRDATVNAQNNAITAGTLYVGYNAGPGQLQNRGTLSVTNLYVANQTFNLNTSDSIAFFTLSGGSTTIPNGLGVTNLDLSNGALATIGTGSVTTSLSVGGAGTTLTLAGPLNMGTGGTLTVYSGGTVNLANHDLTAEWIYLGYYGAGATLQNRATITATNYLFLGNGQSFTFGAADSTRDLYMVGASSATTANTASITGGVYLSEGSSLTLNGDLNVPGYVVDIRASTLNAQGHAINANVIYVGYNESPGQITNKGQLTAYSLFVADQTFNLAVGDSITNFTVYGGATTLPTGVSVSSLDLSHGAQGTVPAGGVTSSASVSGAGTKLTLTGSQDLGVSGTLNVYSGGTVDFGGHNLTAGNIYLGYNGAGATLQNRGVLTATSTLFLGNGQSFTFGASDSTHSLYVYDSSATTAAAGNVTEYVYMDKGSLTLGAPLSISSLVDVRNGAVLNAQGRAITAQSISIGPGSNDNGSALQNAGPITTTTFSLDKHAQAKLIAGTSTVTSVSVKDASTLTISHAGGQDASLTITDTSTAALTIEDTSKLIIALEGSRHATVLQWANPEGGNHIADLNSLIAADKIQFTYTNGAAFQIWSDESFTYLIVPEPATTLLASVGLLAVGGLVRRRLRRSEATLAA